MANINTVVTGRFEAGGVLTITPQGGSALIILNIEPYSFKMKPPFIKPIEYTDRQALQDPLEGETVPGEMRVTVRASVLSGTELFTAMTARKAIPDGKVPKHMLEAKVPSYAGSIAGQKHTTNSAYLKDVPELKTGKEFDTYELVFGINDLTSVAY